MTCGDFTFIADGEYHNIVSYYHDVTFEHLYLKGSGNVTFNGLFFFKKITFVKDSSVTLNYFPTASVNLSLFYENNYQPYYTSSMYINAYTRANVTVTDVTFSDDVENFDLIHSLYPISVSQEVEGVNLLSFNKVLKKGDDKVTCKVMAYSYSEVYCPCNSEGTDCTMNFDQFSLVSSSNDCNGTTVNVQERLQNQRIGSPKKVILNYNAGQLDAAFTAVSETLVTITSYLNFTQLGTQEIKGRSSDIEFKNAIREINQFGEIHLTLPEPSDSTRIVFDKIAGNVNVNHHTVITTKCESNLTVEFFLHGIIEAKLEDGMKMTVRSDVEEQITLHVGSNDTLKGGDEEFDIEFITDNYNFNIIRNGSKYVIES